MAQFGILTCIWKFMEINVIMVPRIIEKRHFFCLHDWAQLQAIINAGTLMVVFTVLLISTIICAGIKINVVHLGRIKLTFVHFYKILSLNHHFQKII